MNDYPYKITRQDKNLSEVEYVQVSNEVKPVAWMIENNSTRIAWMHGSEDHEDGFGWSSDANRGIRFCRKQDADGVIERMGWGRCDNIKSTEHIFMGEKESSPLSPEEMRQIIEALQLGKLVIDASENSWDAFDLIGSAIKLLESRL